MPNYHRMSIGKSIEVDGIWYTNQNTIAREFFELIDDDAPLSSLWSAIKEPERYGPICETCWLRYNAIRGNTNCFCELK